MSQLPPVHSPRPRQSRHTDYNANRRDPKLTKFYKSYRWKQLSKFIRRRDSLCIMCRELGVLTPSQVTDHIVPVRDNWQRRWNVDNLRGLCKSCHDRHTLAAREGGSKKF